MTLLDEIPGLREAIEAESTARDEAFLDSPEFISGVEVMPFTIAHFCTLNAIHSPFTCGGPVTALDVAMFMWVVSYERRRALRARRALSVFSRKLAAAVFWCMRWRFVARLRKLNAEGAVEAIDTYLDEALAEAPKGNAGSYEPSYWSTAAGYVALLSWAYGWSEAEVMELRTKRAFQYLKVATKIRNPGAIMFNPKSDAVRSEYLKQLNEGKAA